jgi:hypothetical protein
MDEAGVRPQRAAVMSGQTGVQAAAREVHSASRELRQQQQLTQSCCSWVASAGYVDSC